MIDNWLFMAACLILILVDFNRKEAAVWAILLLACILNIVLNSALFPHMALQWQCVTFGALECLTIFALWFVCKCKLAYLQIALLCLGFVFHFTLMHDVIQGSNVIYDRYEYLIRAIMVAQIALGGNGIIRAIRNFRNKEHSLGLAGIAHLPKAQRIKPKQR